eukprot:1396593-Rhodomonas_salina.1
MSTAMSRQEVRRDDVEVFFRKLVPPHAISVPRIAYRLRLGQTALYLKARGRKEARMPAVPGSSTPEISTKSCIPSA